MEANDPPIEINQVWVSYVDRQIFRKVRVLAQMPKPTGLNDEEERVWLLQELAAKMNVEVGRITRCPEFNLRYVFSLKGMYDG
jgi:hypothetical protein